VWRAPRVSCPPAPARLETKFKKKKKEEKGWGGGSFFLTFYFLLTINILKMNYYIILENIYIWFSHFSLIGVGGGFSFV
jgi:hypothetical protein